MEAQVEGGSVKENDCWRRWRKVAGWALVVTMAAKVEVKEYVKVCESVRRDAGIKKDTLLEGEKRILSECGGKEGECEGGEVLVASEGYTCVSKEEVREVTERACRL